MSPRLRTHLRLLLALIVCAAAAPTSAMAGVDVAGTGEPAYTKGTTNSYWISYSSGGFQGYKLDFLYGVDSNGSYASETATVRGATNTTTGYTDTGTIWFDFSGVVNTLQDGHSYGGCVRGEDYYSYLGQWVPGLGGTSCTNGNISGKSTFTTIDNSKPLLAVAVNGTATYANTSPLNVTIQYQDSISPPWANSNPALGANAICIRSGGNPSTVCNGQTFNYDPNCSTLSAPRSKNTSFACTINVDPSTPDGPVTLCAVASDSAIPDNGHYSSNQLVKSGGAAISSNDANQSTPVCGWVTFDRTAPSLSVAAPSAVDVGQLVTVTGTGSDATSGLSGNWTWDFGDNTPAGSGASATHTYTQAGTYQVKGTSKDNAGNTATATATVKVNAAAVVVPTPAPTATPAPVNGAGNGGTGSTGTGSTGTGGTGGTGTGTGSGTTTTAPTTSAAGGTVTAPPTAAQIVAAAGGSSSGSSANPASSTLSASGGAINVLAPKTVTFGKKSFAVALTSTSPGKADLAFVKNGKIKSKGSVTLTAAGTIGFSLKLPKSLPVGTYDLQVVLTPTGGGKPSTVKLKVKIAAAKKKTTKKAKASAARVGASAAAVSAAEFPGHPVGLPAPGVDPALALAH